MDSFEEIRKLNNKIDLLRDECTNELNEVNYAFWPDIAKLKKKRKNSLWLTTIFGCVVFCVVIWILFFEIVNEYWIAASLVFSGGWLTFFLIRFIVFNGKYKLKNEEWQKMLASPLAKKEELNDLQVEAVEKMKQAINDENILKDLSDKYSDVYAVYDSWVNQE